MNSCYVDAINFLFLSEDAIYDLVLGIGGMFRLCPGSHVSHGNMPYRGTYAGLSN